MRRNRQQRTSRPASVRMILLALSLVLGMATAFRLPPQSSSPAEDFIIGGVDIDIKDAPFAAILEYNGFLICGGTIIHSSFILTAAHCLDTDRGLPDVRVGSTKREGGRVYATNGRFVHPKFDYLTVDYDIGLLRLSESLTFDKYVQPIPLSTSTPAVDEKVAVYGWGYLTNQGPLSDNLQRVVVEIADRERCNAAYGGGITSRMLCAMLPGKDSCRGDSGGPLVFNGTVAGTVSFGIECASPDYPGVYSNVADPEMLEFVEKTIEDNQ